MINLNGTTPQLDESYDQVNFDELTVTNSNIISMMKTVDFMREENQENVGRVHVLCCDKCDFLTISLNALQQHMTLLHSIPNEDFNNLTIYLCQECKCVSTELKLIKEHIKMFHKVMIENTSTSSRPETMAIRTIALPSSIVRHRPKSVHTNLAKTQLKIRRKLLARKSLSRKLKSCRSSDVDVEDSNNNGLLIQIKKENEGVKTEMDVNDNDPLDMSMKSTTCLFKGTKCETLERHNGSHPVKQEATSMETYDNNNALFSNPQTCIELIKLTLSQMLNKNTDQNRVSQMSFNQSAFFQPQFQLPPNIIPLLQIQNDGQNLNMESILANIQQQNLIKTGSTKSFEPQNHILTYQQSPLFLNQKFAVSSANVTKSPFLENAKKNFSISPSKSSNDFQNKTPTKRSSKKQTVPTKVRNGSCEDLSFLHGIKFECQKVENTVNENLFNRSFLDSSEQDPFTEGADLIDTHSNKSSPNAMSHDKPHRQNFTSQQNRILSDWFFTHCDKPYPSTEDTKDLSLLSGLSYSQVKKWFANKRARSSLNKKNHKNYGHTTPGDSTMEEMCNGGMLSASPSSDSHKSYSNPIDVTQAIDFTTYCPQDTEPQNTL